MKGNLAFWLTSEKEFEPHHQILLTHIDRLISHLVIRLDEEINAEEGVSYVWSRSGEVFEIEGFLCREEGPFCLPFSSARSGWISWRYRQEGS